MRKFCDYLRAVILGLFISTVPIVTVFASDSMVQFNAESVLVMDAKTGEVLFESFGRTRRYPASITKIMTALLVLERAEDLDERVVFSARAVDLPGYASRMNMYQGECMSVLEALYAIMLTSGNDVARALAEHFSGSEAEFVAQMNRRAIELGARNTHFVNPCGLPGDGQFTTAFDIALVMRAAVRHPLFVEIISTPYFTLPPSAFHDEPRVMRNTNMMVHFGAEEFNPYAVGGKTGFTNAAQHTLVSLAVRDDLELIIAVLFASPRAAIFDDTAMLMEFVFGRDAEESQTIPEIKIFDEPEFYEPEIYENPGGEPEAIPALLYEYEEVDYTPENAFYPVPPAQSFSNIDIIIAVVLSIATMAVALFALIFLHKKL